MPGGCSPEAIAVADDDGRGNEHKETVSDEGHGPAVRAATFVQGQSPQRAEDNDGGNVQRPTGESESTYLRLAYAVEENFQLPDEACLERISGSTRQAGQKNQSRSQQGEGLSD